MKQLTEVQWKAINHLVTGTMKKGDIAKECGISPQAFSYWQREPVFRRELHKAFAEAKDEAFFERVKIVRQIVTQGLTELERRFKKGNVTVEKTKDIIDVVKQVIVMEDKAEVANKVPEKQNDEGNEESSDLAVGGELDDKTFRTGLRQLLKGEGPQGVPGVGTKKPIRKPRR